MLGDEPRRAAGRLRAVSMPSATTTGSPGNSPLPPSYCSYSSYSEPNGPAADRPQRGFDRVNLGLAPRLGEVDAVHADRLCLALLLNQRQESGQPLP